MLGFRVERGVARVGDVGEAWHARDGVRQHLELAAFGLVAARPAIPPSAIHVAAVAIRSEQPRTRRRAGARERRVPAPPSRRAPPAAGS